MKSKKSVYILLPLVILVWSLIIYRLISGLGDEEENWTQSNVAQVTEVPYEKPDYDLLLDYEDPFLTKKVKRRKITKKKSQKTAKKKAPPPKKEDETVPMPNLKYLGMISKSGNVDKVGLLMIDNTSHMVKAGDEVGGVTVKLIHEKGITLAYEGKMIELKL